MASNEDRASIIFYTQDRKSVFIQFLFKVKKKATSRKQTRVSKARQNNDTVLLATKVRLSYSKLLITV